MNTELTPPNPKANPQPTGRLGKIGLALVVLGFGATQTFARFDANAVESSGFCAAAIAGIGISLLLVVASRRLVAAFGGPSVVLTECDDPARNNQRLVGEQWRRCTVLAFIFSRLATAAAVAAYGAGVAIYFTNFSFGSGGSSFGGAVMLAGMVVGLSAIIGDIVSLVTACLTWKHLGTKRWFFTASILVLLEIVAIAFLWSTM